MKQHNVTCAYVQEGQAYLFRVAAENEVGVGEFVELPNAVTPKSQHGKLVPCDVIACDVMTWHYAMLLVQ